MLFEQTKLEKEEQLLRIVRKHWFILFERLFGVAFLTFFPFLCYLLLRAFLDFELTLFVQYPQLQAMTIFLSAAWFLFNIMMVAYIWTDYYLDLWAITDRRIIAINQHRFFSRHVGSFRLERVQDLNIQINGLIATFLNYGTIEVQTASFSKDEFRVKGMPDPRGLKALIAEQADKRMKQFNAQNPTQ